MIKNMLTQMLNVMQIHELAYGFFICVLQATVIAKWSNWEDTLAGIDSYHLEVYHLQLADSVLVHGGKVLNAVETKLSPDISEVI